MDDASFTSLKTALAATPNNIALLLLVLRTYVTRDESEQAYELLRSYDPSQDISPEHLPDFNLLAADICCKARRFEQALTYIHEESAESLLLRAKAYLGLQELQQGKQAYEKAVALNPTLEDPALRDQLNAKEVDRDSSGVSDLAGHRKAKLRVISNDNTDTADIVRLIAPQEEKIAFKDIGGLEHIKKTIHKKIILPYQKPSLFQKFKKRIGGGILMYGPPGCGKTLLARATAGECNAQFFNVSISDVLDMYIGESERKLNAIFDKARQSAPAVLFFDEVEALGGKRMNTRDSTSSKLVSQFLSEMDGFAQNNHGVLILAATNVPWSVDPAFRRPGRFDRVLFVPPPDQEARAAILEKMLAERPTAGTMDIAGIARQTSGFSGADLRELVETAVDCAIEESIESAQEQPITMAHIKSALKEVKPTTLEWLTTARNFARYSNEGGQYDEVLSFLKKYGKN